LRFPLGASSSMIFNAKSSATSFKLLQNYPGVFVFRALDRGLSTFESAGNA